jgi:hypothetical protein
VKELPGGRFEHALFMQGAFRNQKGFGFFVWRSDARDDALIGKVKKAGLAVKEIPPDEAART